MHPDDRSDPEEQLAEHVLRRAAGGASGAGPAADADPTLAAELARVEREQARLDALLDAVVTPLGERTRLHRTPAPPDPSAVDGGAGLRAGMVVAGYELVAPLGSGGMGVVWEARQRSLGRRVALKFIRPELAHGAALERFRTEALAGGRINHPNIVSVIDWGEHEGRRWLAQELVEGGCTLRDVVDDMRALTRLPADYDRRVAELFLRVAEALQAAHDQGVIHRDIKPQNILITRDDRPKVGDFGLARLVDERSATRLGLAGSIPYMSPEQAAAKSIGIDARTDIFSLGAVLYEVLTLCRAFRGDSDMEVLEHILHDDPPDPRLVRAGVPRDLAVIAMGALEKRRDDRYPSMAALAEDLRRFLRDETIVRQPPGPLGRARRWVRRHPGRAASLALGLLLAASLAVLVPALVEQWSKARDAQLEALYVRAMGAVERGELAASAALLEEARELDPQDARAHLYAAAALVQYSRFRDATAEMELAVKKGLAAREPERDDDAEAHYAWALHVLLTRKSAGYADVERHLVRALELDPSLRGALYPLYQVRKETGDVAGAREALSALRLRLTLGDPFYTLVEALLAELDGDSTRALSILAPLAELPPARRIELRLPLVVGRNRLILADLDGAAQALREQVEAAPENGVAWEYLAQIELRRARSAPAPELAQEHLRRAGEAAARASGWDPARVRPYHLRVEVELAQLQVRPDRYRALPPEAEARARERLDELRRLDADDALLPAYTSDLDFELALTRFGAGDPAGGRALLEGCLETYPDNLMAGVLLAQDEWGRGEHARSLARFEHALSIWEPGRWTCDWLFTIQVWIFGTADRTGDVERARRALDGAEDWLVEADCTPDSAALLTLAEFLAQPQQVELVDCARALELIEQYDLDRVLGEREDARAALGAVRSACD